MMTGFPISLSLSLSRRVGVHVLLALVLAGISTVAGATDVDWWTVDGGGGRSAGSGSAMTFTVGQPDAGLPAAAGDFTLSGGFWTGSVTPPEPPLFADDFESGGLSAWSASTGGSAAGLDLRDRRPDR